MCTYEKTEMHTVLMGQLDTYLGVGGRIILKQLLKIDGGYHKTWCTYFLAN